MSQLKTIVNNASVTAFIAAVDNPQRRKDATDLLVIFSEATGMVPKMWGGSIIGYGSYHYKSERSTQEGDWPLTAFSPRKQNLTVYIMPGFDRYQAQLQRLGKHTHSVSCLYIKRLSDIDIDVLKEIISDSVAVMKKTYTVQ